MEQLKQAIQGEMPAINSVVEKYISELPAHSQTIARHIFLAGGKRLRPLLALWVGRLFGCYHEHLYTIGASLEILHAATLLHDDIMDNADKRRGVPTAHTQFHPTHVILAGDAMLAKSLCLVSELGDSLLTQCLSNAALQTAEGQIAELANIRNVGLSYEKYIEIITGKTAWILMTACKMAAMYAKASDKHIKAMATFGLELGIAFQLIDDALDFSPSEQTGKPCGGDLVEGKMTPPLLHYIKSLPEQEREGFIRQFNENSFSPQDISAIAHSIYTEGHTKNTQEAAKKHIDNALEALTSMPDAPEKKLLEDTAKYIITRSH